MNVIDKIKNAIVQSRDAHTQTWTVSISEIQTDINIINARLDFFIKYCDNLGSPDLANKYKKISPLYKKYTQVNKNTHEVSYLSSISTTLNDLSDFVVWADKNISRLFPKKLNQEDATLSQITILSILYTIDEIMTFAYRMDSINFYLLAGLKKDIAPYWNEYVETHMFKLNMVIYNCVQYPSYSTVLIKQLERIRSASDHSLMTDDEIIFDGFVDPQLFGTFDGFSLSVFVMDIFRLDATSRALRQQKYYKRLENERAAMKHRLAFYKLQLENSQGNISEQEKQNMLKIIDNYTRMITQVDREIEKIQKKLGIHE